jgi:ABC transporter DrrB family efflux protein
MTATAFRPTTASREHVTVRDAISDTAVITRRNLVRIVRLPQLLLFATIQPLMFLVLFTYVFGGAITQALPPEANELIDGKFIIYLLPGLMVQISVFGSGQTALGLTEDLSKGVIDRFRSLPMARSAVLAGRTLADLVRGTCVMALMLVIAFALGFRYQTSFWSFLAGFAVIMGFTYALTWVMATIGLVVRNPEATQTAVFLPVFPFVFASAVFVPVQTMPAWLQVFAEHQPVSAVAQATRGLMVGEAALQPGQTVAGQVVLALLWTFGILAVFAPLAVRVYRRVVS